MVWFGVFGWVWLLPCSRVWFLVSTAVSLFLSVLTSVCNTRSLISVADPDPNPDPSDPNVFGLPGSGYTKQRYFQSRFLDINTSLHRLEFLSGFLRSFFLYTKCYSRIDSNFLVSRIFRMYFKNHCRVWFSLKIRQ
jgi:hypothetical protein